MERDVVEDRVDPLDGEVRDERVARTLVLDEKIVEMPVLPAVPRDDWPAHPPSRSSASKASGSDPRSLSRRARDRVGLLELGPQERRDDLARQVRRADVDPGVLVDLAAEELPAVRALLADDLGRLDEARVVDSSAPPSPQMTFLVSWKLSGAEVADASERPPAVRGHESLGGVLDHDAGHALAAISMIASISQATPA